MFAPQSKLNGLRDFIGHEMEKCLTCSTIDKYLRDYFLIDHNRLNPLFEAVKQTLFYRFNRNNCKYDTFKSGILLTLHTFGHALN